MHLWVIYLFKNPVFVCEDVLDCGSKFSPAQTSRECELRCYKTSDDWMTDSSVFAEGKVLADLVGLGRALPI